MARIAIVVSNPCVSDARVIKVARAARDNGHEVHIFGTAGRDVASYETVDGLTYHRLEWRPAQIMLSMLPLSLVAMLSKKVATWIAKRVAPYVKYRLFSRIFTEHIAELRPELVHAHDLICLPAAARAAELCGARLIYDAHELETHRNPPLPLLQKLWVGHIERKYTRRASDVITVGDSIAKILARELRRERVRVIYNSPIIEPCPRKLRTDLALGSNVRVVVYVGKVTMGRGLESMLKVLGRLQNTLLASVGPSDPKQAQQLRQMAQRLGVADRFRMLPPVPFEQVVEYIRGADLGVISVEPITLSYQLCMPNKLFELAFAGIPIISNRLDDVEAFLQAHALGTIVDFENEAHLVYSIERALSGPRHTPSPEQAQHLEDHYSWNAQRRLLASIYAEALGAK